MLTAAPARGLTFVITTPPSFLTLVPLIASVVATAELLAMVARLSGSRARDAKADFRRAGAATLLGAVFAVVAFVGSRTGSVGFLPVVLASGACILLATALAYTE